VAGTFGKAFDRIVTDHHDPNLAAIRRLLASIPSLFVGIDDARRVRLWNPVAEQVLGLREADVLGRPLEACGATWETAPLTRGVARCMRSGRPERIDGLRCDRGGHPPAMLGLTLVPLGADGLHGMHMVIIGADVSERWRLEEQLARAQKMEAIGHLAAGIAHEISTPAQFVGDNTQFLKDAFGDLQQILGCSQALAEAVRTGQSTAQPLREMEAAVETLDLAYLSGEVPLAIDHILDGVQRISKIVRSMKLFAHSGEAVEKAPLDLNEAIESTIVISRHEWKYVADVETDLDPDLPPVAGRRGEINQVLLNLVTNAAHAIAAKAQGQPGDKGRIRIQTRCRNGWAEVRIQDSGSGIPDHLRSRVFDLFFTTKTEGRGSGQGLAIAHAVVVDKHAGELCFESEVDQGTTFIIRLPIEEGPQDHV
jgi:signal transduction histidine kinase